MGLYRLESFSKLRYILPVVCASDDIDHNLFVNIYLQIVGGNILIINSLLISYCRLLVDIY